VRQHVAVLARSALSGHCKRSRISCCCVAIDGWERRTRYAALYKQTDRMFLRLFIGSHGTLVAISAPLMMPLRDPDIPMNVPFTFRNKQPLPQSSSVLSLLY
jgi:hypothetical protein